MNASSTPNAVGAWQRETFDVTSLVHGKGQVSLRFRAVTGAATPATFYVDDVALDIRQLVPKYWDNAYLNAYKTFVTALGKRYAGDPRVQFVAIGTGMGGENQPGDDLQDYVFADCGPGQRRSGLQTINAITSHYQAAFKDIGGQLRTSLLLQYAPTFRSAEREA